MLSPIEIDQVSDLIRKQYVSTRRLSFPKYSPTAKRYDTIWTRAAEWCLSTGVTPENLVRVAFEKYQPYPQPNHLLSQALRNLLTIEADKYGRQSVEQAELLFRIELNIVELRTRYGQTYQQIIEDENVDISYVLRYSLAIRAGLIDLAMRMKQRAVLETRFHNRTYVALVFKGIEQWLA